MRNGKAERVERWTGRGGNAEISLGRFETVNGRAFVSGALQPSQRDTLAQVPTGRGRWDCFEKILIILP